MRDGIAIAISISIALTGCTSQPKSIEPTSASTNQYESYTCDQLVAERHRIQLQRIDQIQIRRDAANADGNLMITGLVFFWPAFLLGAGQKVSDAIEYDGIRDRLVADNEAVKKAAVKKNCIGAATPSQQSPGQVTEQSGQ